jgi:drug/metabolite transporter superfamily protein YnfA
MGEVNTEASTHRLIEFIKKIVFLIVSAVVSRIGLTILSLSIIGLISRFFFNIAQGLMNAGFIDEEVFEKFGDGIAIRLIAVGVLLAERHEILVFAGRHNEHDGPDQFSRATRPYGAVYLAFGLVLEVLLEQVKIPFFPSSGSRVGLIIAILAILIMIASVLASISLLYDAWKAKPKSVDISSKLK